MSIIFYDHLVNKHEILLYINNLEEPDNHKGKLRQLVDDIIHQGIVEFILQKLHPHHHRHFLTHLDTSPFDPEIISYLKEKISHDIEDQIQRKAQKLLRAIKKDLKK